MASTPPGVSQQVSGQDQFFDTDWLGSTRYLMDGSGTTTLAWQRYDAFGQRTVQFGPDFPSEFLFAGAWGYENEYSTAVEPGVGLQYLHNRYYDPAVGRFISPDPTGFDGGLNPYRYAGDDPVNAVDPEGLADEGSWVLPDDPSGRQPGSQQLLRAINTGARYGRQGIEFAGSFNELTNAGLAANDIKDRKYGSALLRFLGPLSRLCGKARGFFRFQNRPGRILLPGGGRLRATEIELTQTVAGHLEDIVTSGALKGQQARPYLQSRLLVDEIINARPPVPDPGGLPGGLRWDVPGTFRGRPGVWELVVDVANKRIVHLNFVRK